MDRPGGLSDGRLRGNAAAQPAHAAVTILDSFPALPASANPLFASDRLFASTPWFEAFLAAGVEAGAEPLFFVLNGAAGPRALVPCQRLPHGDPSVSSLTSFYSCDFR